MPHPQRMQLLRGGWEGGGSPPCGTTEYRVKTALELDICTALSGVLPASAPFCLHLLDLVPCTLLFLQSVIRGCTLNKSHGTVKHTWHH